MIGSIISHYKIIKELGKGGMGVVYQVEDIDSKEILAIKVLSSLYSSDEEIKNRLHREAQASMSLIHDNICHIREIDATSDGRLFLVMEYCEGETLKEKIDRGAIPVETILPIMRQVVIGLAKAHEKGIVHRDIKPANIMITDAQRIKILDFGFAKVEKMKKLTTTGTLIGTIAYMSPEMIAGHSVDQRSDIWSLGVMLYESLTKSLPYDGENDQAIMYSIVKEIPEKLSQLNPDLPVELQTIIDKTIAKRKEDRYQNVLDILADFDKIDIPLSMIDKTTPLHLDQLIGQTIDNYQFLSVLGRGGMGIVYKAMDVNLEKIVAIKMMDPMLTNDAKFMKRFRSEAKALAKLDDPHIVKVNALRVSEQATFIVMEYVEGIDLANLIQNHGPLSWRNAVNIYKQLLIALSHAHQTDVVHRDIKPSNILITLKKQVKLTDFGLAKVRQKGWDSTVTQMKAGTIFYMSPEQVKGLQNVDHRSDLYSLGMTFYEILIGKVPFRETDSEFTILKSIIEDYFPPPAKMNPDIPKSLSRIIMKMIEKEPNNRFQSADEVLEAINKFEEEVLPKPVPKTRSLKKITTIVSLTTLVLILSYSSFRFGLWDKFFHSNGNPPEININIESNPPGALVFLGQNQLGRTPLNQTITQEGSLKLELRKENFITIDTTIYSADSDTINLSMSMKSLLLEEDKTAVSVQKDMDKVGSLRIISSPAKAEIWIDRLRTGYLTPYNLQNIEPGSYKIRLKKDGYQWFETSKKVESGRASVINVRLVELTGDLKIISNPPGAQISLNGVVLGKTPYHNKRQKPGIHKLVLNKQGYNEYSEQISVTQREPCEILVNLAQIKGILNILAIPSGSIYADNVLLKENSNSQFRTELPVGKHVISIRNEQLGARWSKEIDIKQSNNPALTVDFSKNHRVTIISNPPHAQIILDGKPTSNYTPHVLVLRTGIHKINVRLPGYILDSSDRLINVDEELTESIHFSLKQLK